MTVPDWVQDAIFYQIFPDRFANGDTTNDPVGVQPWGSPPTLHGYQGGDLRGIVQKLDYLEDLGVTALYLNPIFQAASTHRYNTVNYYQIDPFLGSLADFKTLLEAAHQRNMKVILDGVFNHCGRGFFAFSDLLENQHLSPYRDWFYVIRFPLDAYAPGEARDYLGWWSLKSLPKFNTSHPPVRQYLLDIARFWMEQGADGWRLDVPNEINDDAFWHAFRHVVKSVNPDAYLLGEIWDGSPHWVGEEMFDGLMHYPFREMVINFLNGHQHAEEFSQKARHWIQAYPLENTFGMYLPLGTHDTVRIRTALEGDLAKTRLAFLLQFTFPGAPAIYYGDEVGLEGGKDPDCRRAFPWEPLKPQMELHRWVQSLLKLRKRLPELRRGEFRTVSPQQPLANSLVYARILEREASLVVVNPGAARENLHLPIDGLGWAADCTVQDLLGVEDYEVQNGILQLEIPPGGGMLLKPGR